MEPSKSGRFRLFNCGFSAGGLVALCLMEAYQDWIGQEAMLVSVREHWWPTRWWMWAIALVVGSLFFIYKSGLLKPAPTVTIKRTFNDGTPPEVVEGEIVEATRD